MSIIADYAIDSHWLNEATGARRLMVAYAHPDDESFGNAGTIARYTSAGVAVHYVCATRGECGSVAPELLSGYANIAELRTAELSCAARALGLASVHYLGYRDSGMQGAADNQHAEAFVQAPIERVTGQVVALMRALRPQVVLTFGPFGGYGHPDHIKIHQATIAAFQASGDPARYPDQIAAGLEPWAPEKLYYPTFGTRLSKTFVTLLRLFGRDPRRFGENSDVDLVEVVANTTPITTTIDSRAYLAQKEQAWRCHASQAGGMGWVQRLPSPIRSRIVGAEHFTRVVPDWDGRRGREHDLFDRVRDIPS